MGITMRRSEHIVHYSDGARTMSAGFVGGVRGGVLALPKPQPASSFDEAVESTLPLRAWSS